jgi:carbon-monoxide dehydrogenase iron sulfur subunit
MGKIVEVNIDRCMGCHSCELACAVAHSRSKDISLVIREGEHPGNRMSVEAFGVNAIPIHCKHCEEPSCVMACPTGAVHRDKEGEPVVVETQRCIGCRMCVAACPFGVITMSSEGKGVLKCDLCVDRLAEGKDPACVTACPTHALLFVEEKDAARNKRQKLAEQLIAARDAQKE